MVRKMALSCGYCRRLHTLTQAYCYNDHMVRRHNAATCDRFTATIRICRITLSSITALLADVVVVALQVAEWDAGCALPPSSIAPSVALDVSNVPTSTSALLPQRVQHTTLVCMSEERGIDGLIAAFNAREGADAMVAAGQGRY